MSMLAARMIKLKTENLVGVGNHNQRRTENHSNKDIDVSKSYLNYDLVNRTENYKTDIEKFIDENKSTKRATRKDAVLINEWIITSDRKFFERLAEDEIKNFFTSAKEYFGENFGEENIRYATVHLDETTPHLHLGIVPFDENKKLSAKRIFNRESLRKIQDDLPKFLQEKGFEIQRGAEGSERKNLTVPEFKKLKEEEKRIEKEIEIKKNELLAYNKKNEIDNLNVNIKREIKKVEIETSEKNFFGKHKTEIVERETGNIILSEKDFLEINKKIEDGTIAAKKLKDILETNIYEENKKLKLDAEKLKELNKKIKEEYKSLEENYFKALSENKKEENRSDDLKRELYLTCKTTEKILKRYTSDSKTFNSIFNELVNEVENNFPKSEIKRLNNIRVENQRNTQRNIRNDLER